MRPALVLLGVLGGCLHPEFGEGDCAPCHGSADGHAPPEALGGETDTSFVGVGAHAAHDAVACEECHLVPATVDAPDHLGAWPAEITWGDLAIPVGPRAWWEHSTGTCEVYCHGVTLDGGTLTVPVWTVVDGTQAACGTCHGLPPPAPHPADTACEGCHFPTAGPGGTIADETTHVDGVVDQGDAPLSCAGCHGTDEDPAPPPDLSGSTDRTDPGVGAHAAHLHPTHSKAVACADCHLVPAGVDDPGHLDTPAPAEVALTGLAADGGSNPTWNVSSRSCSDVYCHGADLAGGDIDAPVWTDTDGAASECGACHGMPPPSPHPGSSNCSGCHPPAGANQTIDQPDRHVDGNVDR